LGWSETWDGLLDERAHKQAVRIIAQHKNLYQAFTTEGQLINCHLSGKMLHGCSGQNELPAVGDWCLVGDSFTDASNTCAAIVQTVLPRYSKISRRRVDLGDEQILAANIDFVFVVTSANRDFNINRVRRYLLLADRGQCQPIIVLSKSDLAEDESQFVALITEAFPNVPTISTSAVNDTGFHAIKRCLTSGLTGVFVGSSGVGKSTMINKLLDADVQNTGGVRLNDERGRHTTSGASLFLIESGGVIIDTAGLREVGLVGDTNQLDESMPTVSELAQLCRFSDCSHNGEPGCAVQAALSSGGLDAAEFDTYNKLARELAYTERKNDRRLAALERKKWKQVAMNNRRDTRRK